MNILAIFIGGGLGSLARYGVSSIIPKDISNFPLATFLSNFLACLILAFAVKYGLNHKTDEKVLLFLITGFCGGFSTFSTFSYENLRLIQDGFWTVAFLNAVLSIGVCMWAMHLILSK